MSTNNITSYKGSEEDILSKIKQKISFLKLTHMKKNLPFHDAPYHLVFLYCSTTTRQAVFPYIIKNYSSEGL